MAARMLLAAALPLAVIGGAFALGRGTRAGAETVPPAGPLPVTIERGAEPVGVPLIEPAAALPRLAAEQRRRRKRRRSMPASPRSAPPPAPSSQPAPRPAPAPAPAPAPQPQPKPKPKPKPKPSPPAEEIG